MEVKQKLVMIVELNSIVYLLLCVLLCWVVNGKTYTHSVRWAYIDTRLQ